MIIFQAVLSTLLSYSGVIISFFEGAVDRNDVHGYIYSEKPIS